MDIPDFFGLDIGNHSIKLSEIKRSGDTATLLHIGAVTTDIGILEEMTDNTIKSLGEQIKKARQVARISTRNCVAAIPESPIFSRLISIPKVEEENIEEAVHWELKPLIPVSLDEVDISFLEVGETQINNQVMINVYVVAAPKVLTERFKRIGEAADVNLIALETESLANTRVVTFNHQTEKDIMVFDFGAYGTDLILARDAVPVFAQNVSTGSDALTKAIASDFGINVAQAEKYKRAYGLNFEQGEGKIARSIEPIMQILVNEMSRTLAYFKEKFGDAGTKKIYMCGEAAKLPGLDAYLEKQLGIPAMLVDPVANVKISADAQSDLQQLSPVGFSVAIGLGLKDS